MVRSMNLSTGGNMNNEKARVLDHGVVRRMPDGTLELVVRARRLLRAPHR